MGLTNYGNQNVIFSFAESGQSENFNKLYYKILKAGIYSGGVLSKKDATTVSLTPLVAFLEDSSTEVGVRAETTETVDITIEEGKEYIILRYAWAEIEDNFMDIIAEAYGNILQDDIIVGRAVYEGGVLQDDFDYTRRNRGRLNESVVEAEEEIKENPQEYFYVSSQEPFSSKVNIGEGVAVDYQGTIHFVSSQTSASIPSTTDGRIDLVYLNQTGTVGVAQGVDAESPVAPTLDGSDGKYVLAKITRGAGATYITGADIENYGRTVAYLNNINLQQLQGVDAGDLPTNNGVEIASLNADQLNGADLSIDPLLTQEVDTLVASEKALAEFIDNNAGGDLTSLLRENTYHYGFGFYDRYTDANKALSLYAKIDSTTDEFGCAIDNEKLMFVVGAYADSVDGANAGCVYAYFAGDADTEDIDSSFTYSPTRLAPDTPVAGSKFGFSVGYANDYAVVGAPEDDTQASGAGAIYIFKHLGSNSWSQLYKITLTGASADELAGYSVSIDGDYIAVGVPGADKVLIYRRTTGDTWGDVATITGSDTTTGDDFGKSVEISGDYVIVGAPGADSDEGKAYIFERTAANTWGNEEILEASDGAASDAFGFAVAIDDVFGICVVGAPDNGRGKAYVYEKTESGNTWGSEYTVEPDTNTVIYELDDFGRSVTTKGECFAVGSWYRGRTTAVDPWQVGGVFKHYSRIDLQEWNDLWYPINRRTSSMVVRTGNPVKRTEWGLITPDYKSILVWGVV